MLSKRCTRCSADKSLDEFGLHRGQPFDRAIWCLECTREADRKRRADPVVKAADAARARAYRKRPEVKKRTVAYDAQYRAENKDKIRARYLSDEGRKRAREFRRSERGREIGRQAEHRRRARRAGAEVVDFTAEQWDEVKAEFDHRCAYCLAAAPLQMDHLKPISHGGNHTKENIVPACRWCNQSKGSKELLQFLTHARPVA